MRWIDIDFEFDFANKEDRSSGTDEVWDLEFFLFFSSRFKRSFEC